MDASGLGQFLHTPEWEHFLRETGATVARHQDILYIRGELPGGGTYWRGSRFTLTDTWEIPPFARNSWFIRLEPTNQPGERIGRYPLKSTHTTQPAQTVAIDLSLPDADILARMKQKHRYNIRVAERHGVAVSLYHSDAPEQFPRFWELLQSTAERHEFRTHSIDHYRLLLNTLAPTGHAHIAFATYQGRDVAAALIITFGNVATYLHGASTHADREVMAPYLLHWDTMRWARTNGAVVYDFWGTNAIQEDGTWRERSHHPSSGTTRFKLGFGGDVTQYPGAFDLVLKQIPYRLYRSAHKVLGHQSSF